MIILCVVYVSNLTTAIINDYLGIALSLDFSVAQPSHEVFASRLTRGTITERPDNGQLPVISLSIKSQVDVSQSVLNQLLCHVPNIVHSMWPPRHTESNLSTRVHMPQNGLLLPHAPTSQILQMLTIESRSLSSLIKTLSRWHMIVDAPVHSLIVLMPSCIEGFLLPAFANLLIFFSLASRGR
ncbi:uncharacterized protein E5676_scaffold203G00010 [Cucumis melo var. makuwa]|uniref:Flocculation protein FLO11-like n=1 Tax=Cucumis melo var. makuwa TaxID=1194695 RepID=A0A5D3BGU8_CUCMM|nr:uncharacterized protein E5676_scaffold203G00010 [Cucumis melo var. makuwa]